MLRKKRIYLFLFGTLGLMLFFITCNTNKPKPQHEDSKQQQKFVNVSQIHKSDPHFYDISTQKDAIKDVTPKKTKATNTTEKYLQDIQKIVMQKSPDIYKLDEVMNNFLMNKNIPRIDKINGLWSILKEIGFSSQRSEYLLDALATLLPIELTDDLIAVYKENHTPNIKIKLIMMLADNTTIVNPEVQNEERLNFIIDKIVTTQEFLKENVLQNESNSLIASEALHAYANISDAQDVQELMTSINEGTTKSSLKKEELSSILTEVSVSTSNTQKEILLPMLESMQTDKTIKKQQKKDFTRTIIQTLNAGALTPEIQAEVSNYLKKQEPKLLSKTKLSTTDISQYYDWAKANSKIKNNNISLKNIALEENNPLKISSILLYGDEKTIQSIQEDPNADNISVKLESALEDDTISTENKTIIKDAIGTLHNTKDINE